jgi:hypothetical protein
MAETIGGNLRDQVTRGSAELTRPLDVLAEGGLCEGGEEDTHGEGNTR